MLNSPSSENAPSSEEERNFLKGCLLVTKLIPNGFRKFLAKELIRASKSNSTSIKSKAMESLENISDYTFQELYALTDCINKDRDTTTGIEHLVNAREEFFKNVRKDRLSGHELDTLIQEVHKGYLSLKVPFDRMSDVLKKMAFSSEELLTIYEQLSRESRTICQFSQSEETTTIQRPREVSLVLNKLMKIKKSNASDNSTFHICGPHGSGKSELAKQAAAKLFNQHIDTSKDPIVLVILDAETEESLLCSYLRFAKDVLGNSMHIKMAVTSKGLTAGQRIRLLKCIIGPQMKRYSNWIVIINNVHHLEKFSSYWPMPGSDKWGCGQIIVTTTDDIGTKTLRAEHTGHVTTSYGMQPSEAIELLYGVSGVVNKNFALEVAEMLEFQPLALSCAACFVKNLPPEDQEPWKTYMEVFQKQTDLHKESNCYVKQENCSELMLVAIKMLVAQLSKQHKKILFLISILGPFPVGKSVILNTFNELGDKESESALETLLDTPLLDSEIHNDNSEVLVSSRCSKIYKQFIEVELTNSTKISILASAITALGLEMSSKLESKSDVNDTVYYHSFIVDTLMSRIGNLKTEERKQMMEFLKKLPDGKVVDIFFEFGKRCQLIQKLENAKISFELAKEIIQNQAKVDLSFESQLFLVLRRLGEISDIAELDTRGYFENALKLCKGERNVVGIQELAEVIDGLGDVTISTGQTSAEARKLYEEALELRRKESEPNDTFCVSVSWFKLGNVCAMEGDFEQAKEHYEKALEIWETTKPEAFDYELVKILTCAGAISICLNEYDSALNYLDRAMKMEERLLSPYHPYRLNTIKNASNACRALGEAERTEHLLKQSLEISKVIGSLDNDVAQIVSELGSLYAAKCDWRTAISYHSWSLQIRENTLCQLHPNIADTCCDLGNAYNNLGDLEKAKIFLERSLGIRGLLFETNHPDVGTSFFRLGEVYNKLDDHQTGLNLLQRAAEIRTRIFGIHHPETLASLQLLGNSFARLGQLRRAKDLYQTVADEQSKLMDTGRDVAQTATSLAEVSLGLGEVDSAKEQYKRAIEIQKKVIGDWHPEMARPLVGLALVHEHCKEFKEAKSLLEKALGIYRKNFSNHPKVLITEMHLKRVIAKLPQIRCIVM